MIEYTVDIISISRMYTLKLPNADVLQILDALESRAEAWEKTSAVLSDDSEGVFFIVEECSDLIEAAEIAQHFRDISAKIELQIENQRKQKI